MDHFEPTRASPPPKHAVPASVSCLSESSRMSGISIAELQDLSDKDVNLLEAVVQRVGSTNTFLAIFKAYSDVLYEQGLDPHEAAYYGKLLKLGTLKEKTWDEKWKRVKDEYGYVVQGTPKSACARVDAAREKHRSENSTPLRDSEIPTRPYKAKHAKVNKLDDRRVLLALNSKSHLLGSSQSVDSESIAGSDRSKTRQHSFLSTPTISMALPHKQMKAWKKEPMDTLESGSSSPTLPSYRSTFKDPPLLQSQSVHSQSSVAPDTTIRMAARQAVAQARERMGSVIDENRAWKNIKMERDEQVADEFRDDRLVERCWEVWKQGIQWIDVTNLQIAEARENLLLRLYFQRWQTRYSSLQEIHGRISLLDSNRRIRYAFRLWKSVLQRKQQIKWRQDMRMKMKTIKDRTDLALKKDVWRRWLQHHQSLLSERHRSRLVLFQFFNRWKRRFLELENLDNIAEDVSRIIDTTTLKVFWKRWRGIAQLKTIENVVNERVDVRIIEGALNTWKCRMLECHAAEEFHQITLKRLVMSRWMAALRRVWTMDNKVIKHRTRQDALLLRAVTRVWRAHERGRLLRRVRSVRLLKMYWSKWQSRLHELVTYHDQAIALSMHSNSRTLTKYLNCWRQNFATHRNALSFAGQYHIDQTYQNILLTWRLRLRDNLRMVKMARIAHNFFATRGAWRAWNEALENKKRLKALKGYEMKLLARNFRAWLYLCRQGKAIRLAELSIESHITHRILSDTLALWTNRVIEVKLRELVVSQRYDAKLQTTTFKKWRNVYERHFEEVRLMDSYLFVKREETTRRVFHRWLTSARTLRHRSGLLHQYEEQLKLKIVSSAWDSWRGKFINERLRPMEYNVIIQRQRHLMFQALGVWRAKTKSLPAISFHAYRCKARFLKLWRDAMPHALQAKVARERDRTTLLSTSLRTWVQNYRTKVTLKAVARARYLKLPTTFSRQPINPRTILKRSPLKSQKYDDEQSVAGPTEEGEEDDSPPRPVLLRPKIRQPSPTRSASPLKLRPTSKSRSFAKSPSSVASAESSRRGLWYELQEIQRKTGVPTRKRPSG